MRLVFMVLAVSAFTCLSRPATSFAELAETSDDPRSEKQQYLDGLTPSGTACKIAHDYLDSTRTGIGSFPLEEIVKGLAEYEKLDARVATFIQREFAAYVLAEGKDSVTKETRPRVVTLWLVCSRNFASYGANDRSIKAKPDRRAFVESLLEKYNDFYYLETPGVIKKLIQQ